ncbi:MAG: hypothetical protein HRT61_11635 [Ekhidna sp.]|nr:hypothetical protein [Ekhidna sp.]
MKYRILMIILLAASGHQAYSQQNENVHISSPYWRISPLIGHTFIALEQGGEHTPIASWALDIEFWWSDHLGIGLHNDLEIESFVVVNQKGEHIERHFPVVTSLDLLVKVWKELVFYAGPGIEFDANESLEVVRLGLEYEFLLDKHFDIAPTFFYDNRFNQFNTWTVAFGMGYKF